jgi:hypothetical protein
VFREGEENQEIQNLQLIIFLFIYICICWMCNQTIINVYVLFKVIFVLFPSIHCAYRQVLWVHNVRAVYATCVFQQEKLLTRILWIFLCLFRVCNEKLIVTSFCWYWSNIYPILQEIKNCVLHWMY